MTTLLEMFSQRVAMQHPRGRLHPSGRPVVALSIAKRTPVLRIPNSEPLTPRLREQSKDLDCVGFIHDFQRINDDE